MRRPGVWLALCVAGGIWMGDRLRPPLELLWVAVLLVWGVSVLWARARPWLIPVLCIGVGALNLVRDTAPVCPADLRHVVAERVPALVTVQGRLVDTPRLRMRIRDGEAMWKTVASLEVTALARGDQWEPARGRIWVLTPGELPPAFHGGRFVEVSGVLERPAGAPAPGLFDYRSWLARRGIHYQLRAATAADWKPIGPETPLPWTDRFVEWATRQLQRGQPPDAALDLLRAMTLGWRTALTDEVAEVFMRSGTMHVFAISGLHIALLGGVVVTLLRVMRLSRAACACVLIPLIWFYTAATGWQPSAVRASLMTSMVACAWLLSRPVDVLNAIGWAAVLILLAEPQQLFHVGFQLSFAVVAALAAGMPKVETWLRNRLRADPLLPPELAGGWRAWTREGVRRVLLAAAVSALAWLGSLPLIAYHFHLVTPVTLVANLVVVPCAALALASCVGSWVCGPISGLLCELFNHSAWLWMRLMMEVSTWAATLPGGSFHVSGPAVPEILGYYIWLAGAAAGALLRPGWRAPWWAVAILSVGVGAWFRWEAARQARLVLLPAAEAPVAYVTGSASGRCVLVNCGTAEDVEFLVKPFLQAEGVDRLSGILLCEALAASGGGLTNLVSAFRPEQLWVGEGTIRSRVVGEALAACERAGARLVRVGRGDSWSLGEVLHPAREDRWGRAADASVVWRASFRGVRVLWWGGLSEEGARVLLKREDELEADLLVLGGSGADRWILSELLERVRPRWVLVADGSPGRPLRWLDGVREVLGGRGVNFWCTSEAGAVDCRWDGRRLRLRSANGWVWEGEVGNHQQELRRAMVPG